MRQLWAQKEFGPKSAFERGFSRRGCRNLVQTFSRADYMVFVVYGVYLASWELGASRQVAQQTSDNLQRSMESRPLLYACSIHCIGLSLLTGEGPIRDSIGSVLAR